MWAAKLGPLGGVPCPSGEGSERVRAGLALPCPCPVLPCPALPCPAFDLPSLSLCSQGALSLSICNDAWLSHHPSPPDSHRYNSQRRFCVCSVCPPTHSPPSASSTNSGEASEGVLPAPSIATPPPAGLVDRRRAPNRHCVLLFRPALNTRSSDHSSRWHCIHKTTAKIGLLHSFPFLPLPCPTRTTQLHCICTVIRDKENRPDRD